MWLWILIGLSIIAKVHGFSTGNFITVCDTMLPKHTIRDRVLYDPQTTPLPFKLDCKPGNEGDPITVVLESIQPATQFRGFMLEALGTSGLPVGKFISLDPSMTRLLPCFGSPDSAVSNRNNQRKSRLHVNWTAQGADGDITFRATFLETFEKFWEPVDKEDCKTTTPTPSPQPSTITSTELSPTSTELSPTSTELSPTSTELSPTSTELSPTSTGLSPTSTELSTTSNELNTTINTTKSNTSEPRMGSEGEDIMMFRSTPKSLSLGLKMALIFIPALHKSQLSRRLNKGLQIFVSLLSVALDISALVFFCLAELIEVKLVALVCVAIVINVIELVIICLPIGPSHELKEICDHAVNVCSVIHQILTIAVIFLGVSDICRKNWLLKAMVTFTALHAIWLCVITTQRKVMLGRRSKLGSLRNSERWRQHGKEKKLSIAEVILIAVSVTIAFGNVCFHLAAAVVILGCQQE